MDTAPTFDLQSHSTHSDGELAPADVVAAAAAAAVRVMALTDHDSVAGVAEAQAAAAVYPSLRLVPAVELSIKDPAANDLHLCGYMVDIENAALLAHLRAAQGERQQRALRMAQALIDLGFELDRSELNSRIAAGKSIGRPHLAMAVLNEPANAQRLAAAGLDNVSAFIEAYLIEGRLAFRPREAPSIAEAIELVHGAGGLAIWAHPFWDLSSDGEVADALARFAALGLDGVEAFYITHNERQTRFAVRLCHQLGLLTTGSADFHGPHHPQFNHFRAFSTFGLKPALGPLAPA